MSIQYSTDVKFNSSKIICLKSGNRNIGNQIELELTLYEAFPINSDKMSNQLHMLLAVMDYCLCKQIAA